MTKKEISESIDQAYEKLFHWLELHGSQYWETGPPGKWNTGQQVKHLIQSGNPLNKALRIPKFILKWKFGKANRPSRSYSQVIQRYRERLASSTKVVSPFSQNMDIPEIADRHILIKELKAIKSKQLELLFRKWNEQELDFYIVPHPLMGKMTVREIVMWSAYHVEHHLQSIKENCAMG